MNLLRDGTHKAADWLRGRIRATKGETVLFVRGDGQLVAFAGEPLRRRAGWREAGRYTRGLTYAQAVDDLAHLANELQQARAA